MRYRDIIALESRKKYSKHANLLR